MVWSPGKAHGLAASLNLKPGDGTVTLESKTNFIAGVKAGETSQGVCEPLHLGRATMIWQTQISRPDGKLAAIVTQTQMTVSRSA